MDLTVYNTATRKKETFTPIDNECVKMYVCGPTVYNFVHIGNARPVVVFDTLFRLLKVLYPKVVYARNITDIDDKIMKAAADNGVAIADISKKYTAHYDKDMAQLNNLRPSIVPYATEHVGEMIAMVETLIQLQHAYVSDGHVLFDVTSMEDYGALSNRSLEDMLEGARVEVASYKQHAGDFVLWKPSADSEPGWDSPWGRGRPGWHLECSAMIEKHLGTTIDIHGGGRDLIFPHHENERAQSQCAHGGELYVKYWMHNGFINIDGEKMSKSLGNFKTVRDLLEVYHGETIRFALLTGHYRSELDFSAQLLEQAKSSLDSLYGALKNSVVEAVDYDLEQLKQSEGFKALLDDLSTPRVVSELHRLAGELNKQPDNLAIKSELMALANLLGILQVEPDAWFQGEDSDDSAAAIEALIKERDQAKRDKNYARADEIRSQLKAEGILLLDSKDGTTWRKE
ncbi:cysteine--tRNA ligase [Agarilytica rhodophyticola]|uniref:cysteine--tRNA ligase n=1 Tax=Agarilytica rhodophyticola TaxID=1737490 RepID=UPI000B341074|nr:cysteine--tRNA ligase [Agarilytica rhodophyticola]